MGIANYLSQRQVLLGNEAFGKSFEHYIFMELMNYKKYKNPELNIHYWRTSTNFEVDFICGDIHTAIEVKSSSRIHKQHLRGLKALRESNKVKNLILVCLEKEPRIVEKNIHILPFKVFLKKLWEKNLLS